MPYMRYTILLFCFFIVLEISFILVLLSWHFLLFVCDRDFLWRKMEKL